MRQFVPWRPARRPVFEIAEVPRFRETVPPWVQLLVARFWQQVTEELDFLLNDSGQEREFNELLIHVDARSQRAFIEVFDPTRVRRTSESGCVQHYAAVLTAPPDYAIWTEVHGLREAIVVATWITSNMPLPNDIAPLVDLDAYRNKQRERRRRSDRGDCNKQCSHGKHKSRPART